MKVKDSGQGIYGSKYGTCHDCYVDEGEIHDLGCDMEECPVCGGQAITCFEHCVNSDGTLRDSFANGKRYPLVISPVHCAMCLEPWPNFFSVPDEEWDRVVPPSLRDKVICKPCYGKIRSWGEEKEELTFDDIMLVLQARAGIPA